MGKAKTQLDILKISVEKQQHATPKDLGQELSAAIASCRHLSPTVGACCRLSSPVVAGRVVRGSRRQGRVIATVLFRRELAKASEKF